MGYIYAMSNKSMPGILKIGMTERSIEERLKEANGTFTLIPFVVEMSKNVLNCKEKEKCIHQILQPKRVNPKKEFFEVTIEEIKPIFDLMDSVENIELKKSEAINIFESNEEIEIKYQEYEVEPYFDKLLGIDIIMYGNNKITIDYEKKDFIHNNISSKSLQFIINAIDNSIQYSDIIKEIMNNNIIKTNNKILKISEIKDLFRNIFPSHAGNGIVPPYKDFIQFLINKYPTQHFMNGFVDLEINYDTNNNEENILDSCYILMDEKKVILSDYIHTLQEC